MKKGDRQQKTKEKKKRMVNIMKKYMVYIDNGDSVMKIAVPSESVKAAKKYCQGNGEIIKVTDVTADFPIDIVKVVTALQNANFGQVEIDLIMRTLTMHNIAE